VSVSVSLFHITDLLRYTKWNW